MIHDRAFIAETQALLPGLYRLSMSILHAHADAQDAVQSALLRAWERREQARPLQFRGWLTRIVINECRNIQRQRMRVFPAADVQREEEAFVPEDGDLAQAIDGLPEKLRTPLLLRYMEGYAEREIAAALGVPVTTVKNRLFRARKALRATLGEEVELQ